MLFGDSEPTIRAAALKASRNLGIRFSDDELANQAAVVVDRDSATQLRIEAMNALAAQNYSKLDDVLNKGLASDNESLRIRLLELLSKDSVVGFAAVETVLANATGLRERQIAIEILAKLGTPKADSRLVREFQKLIVSEAFPGTELELLETAQARSTRSNDLAMLVAEFEDSRSIIADQEAVNGFTECLTGGDTTVGQKNFMTHITVQCIRCHKVGKTGCTVGENRSGPAVAKGRQSDGPRQRSGQGSHR